MISSLQSPHACNASERIDHRPGHWPQRRRRARIAAIGTALPVRYLRHSTRL